MCVNGYKGQFCHGTVAPPHALVGQLPYYWRTIFDSRNFRLLFFFCFTFFNPSLHHPAGLCPPLSLLYIKYYYNFLHGGWVAFSPLACIAGPSCVCRGGNPPIYPTATLLTFYTDICIVPALLYPTLCTNSSRSTKIA